MTDVYFLFLYPFFGWNNPFIFHILYILYIVISFIFMHLIFKYLHTFIRVTSIYLFSRFIYFSTYVGNYFLDLTYIIIKEYFTQFNNLLTFLSNISCFSETPKKIHCKTFGVLIFIIEIEAVKKKKDKLKLIQLPHYGTFMIYFSFIQQKKIPSYFVSIFISFIFGYLILIFKYLDKCSRVGWFDSWPFGSCLK